VIGYKIHDRGSFVAGAEIRLLALTPRQLFEALRVSQLMGAEGSILGSNWQVQETNHSHHTRSAEITNVPSLLFTALSLFSTGTCKPVLE